MLASNTSSLPEVLGEAALLVNPENVFEIARGMKSILIETTVRERLIARGLKHITRFSWESAARQVIEAGADVLVAGSAVFSQADYGAAMRAIREDGAA